MIYDKQRISNALKAVKSKNTAPEILLRKALRSFGIIGYRLHWNKAPGKPDIAFPSRKIAIFVHGCFWHRCPYCKQKEPQTNVDFWNDKFRKTKERDRKTEESLYQLGWKVIIIWECQINENVDYCIEVIKKIYNSGN